MVYKIRISILLNIRYSLFPVLSPISRCRFCLSSFPDRSAFLPLDVFLLVLSLKVYIPGRTPEQKGLQRISRAFFTEWNRPGEVAGRKYAHAVRPEHRMSDTWTKADFDHLRNTLRKSSPGFASAQPVFCSCGTFYHQTRILLNLMANDNLMESERFSQLLLAIFHPLRNLICVRIYKILCPAIWNT